MKSPYFRTSYQKLGKPVNKIIKETLPNTVILAVSSMIIAVFIGLLFGIISTIYKDQLIDRILLLISTLGMSIPSFLVPFYSHGYSVSF